MNSKERLPIVVGVDGTDESLQAVRYAVDQAQRRGCAVRLVHAVPQYAPMAPMLPLLSVDSLEEVGHRLVGDAKLVAYDLTDGELDVDKVVRQGPRSHVLLSECQNASLVVLGQHDRSRIDRIFSGSTVTGVAARAHCPVVTVPATWTPVGPRGRIVVGVENSNHDDDAVAAAFGAASERGAELVVLHAWTLQSPYDSMLSRDEVAEWEEGLEKSIAAGLREWQAAFADVPIRLEVRHQRPVDALVELSTDADLVVVGRHGHRVLREAHLGSVTRTLVRESRCPVLVAPPRDATALTAADLALTADEVSPQT